MLLISALVAGLRNLNAPSGGVYSTSDLSVLLEQSHPVLLNKSIHMLIRDGVLQRVRRGLYVDRLHGHRAEILGQRWLSPSYLSTEAALSRYQLCDTGILAHTYVTKRLLPKHETARRILEGQQFIYRHVVPHLFFGYRVEEGLWLAEPEKAVLDFLYFTYKKQRSALSPDDVDFRRLNQAKFRKWLRAYRQRGFESFALRWLPQRGSRS